MLRVLSQVHGQSDINSTICMIHHPYFQFLQLSYIADERDRMLPQIHGMVPSDSKLEAERITHRGSAGRAREGTSGTEETREAEQPMVNSRSDVGHAADGFIEVSIMGNTSASTSNDVHHGGLRQLQQSDPERGKSWGTHADSGGSHSEREEGSPTAMLIDIDTPEDLRHADVIDEERRQLAKIEDQKRIAECPKSWTCLKCSMLNSHRSRSCDSCADKKPPPVLVPRVKFAGPGRPRDENKRSKDMSQSSVKKSHKKKVYVCSPEDKLVAISKPHTGEPLLAPNVKAEKISTKTPEDGLLIQTIKKSHKKKVVLSMPAEITAATIPSQVEGTVSTAIA